MDAFKSVYTANARVIFEQIGLAEIAEDTLAPFVLQVGPPWTVMVEGEEHSFFARYDDADPHELHLIDRLVVTGTADIHVDVISLTHRKLGEVMYAFGEGKVAGRKALVVVTEGEGGGKATFRVRPVDGTR